MLKMGKSLPPSSFTTNFFSIDSSVAIKMHCLQIIAWWHVSIPRSHTLQILHVFICSFNTNLISFHKNDVFLNHNFQHFIYCVSMKHNSTHKNQILHLSLILNKHSNISVYEQNNEIIVYNNFITLTSHETFTTFGSWIYCNNIQHKYKKDYSHNNHIYKTSPFFNIPHSPWKAFGPNVNVLSTNNNWWFQHWHAWSKLSTMRWT